MQDLKTQKDQETQNRTMSEARLQALTEYYAQRETAMQGLVVFFALFLKY